MKGLFIRIIILGSGILSAFASSGIAIADQPDDYLSFNYYDFVQAFESRDSSTMSNYLGTQSKVGQEIGVTAKALFEYVDANTGCREHLLTALYAGCKKTRSTDGVSCAVPPQLDNPEIVYIGPKASLNITDNGKSLKVNYLTCAGD